MSDILKVWDPITSTWKPLSVTKGDPGIGIATGGTAGQILAKKSGTDYDTQWIDNAGGGTWGSITGTLSNQTDLQSALDTKEAIANKVTSLSSSSTDAQYPSAKAVYDYIQSLDGNSLEY